MTSGTHGVIALDAQTCTSCMICARECPDWCITIEAHHESAPATTSGARARGAGARRTRTQAVLDSFTIDFSLCLYCGICIEVCPVDALAWAPDRNYSGAGRVDLLHDLPRLVDWLHHVPEPIPREEGAVEPVSARRRARP